MKKDIFAALAVFAFIFSAFGVGFAQTKGDVKIKTGNQMLALLPASDAAVVIDVKRLYGEAMPQILASNQPLLTEISDDFERIKTTTGIDFRQFQQVAVGVNTVEAASGQYSFEPVVLARGQYNAAALTAIARIASNGKYREEKIGDRTIYVFSAKEIIEQRRGKIGNSFLSKIIDKALAGLTSEMALTAYDANTIAIGSTARVRDLFEGKTRLGGEVLGLVSRKPNAIVSFGARVPGGLAKFLDLDNDELGKNLEAVRVVSGSMDVVAGNTAVSFSAKTVNAEQAKGLKETLDGLQMLGKALLGSAKTPDKQVYARMIENAKLAQTGNEITLDVLVPQADLNVIVGAKK